MSRITVEALLESGAHFGHLTRRWNPKMRRFIYTQRNGIHIIDVRKTQVLADLAFDAMFEAAAQGRSILFVGTKNQAKEIVSGEARRCGAFHVSERWLGGMLTNFSTIRKSIKRLNSIDRMEKDGTFEKITKKERLMLGRERDRLRKTFGGIEEMTRLPGAIFVIDVRKEHIAIKEAHTLEIPVIGMVDTNSDPDVVNYPIPSNDDSVKAIELMCKLMADAVIEGREVAKVRAAEMGATPERINKEQDNDDRRNARRMRPRRRRDGEPEGEGDFLPSAEGASTTEG